MNSFMIEAGRKRRATVTLEEQPGAHTGDSRKYIPGYSDSNIIFRAPTTGNDANDGLTELTPKQTKSACDTAAGSTKKIRIIEACSLSENIEKPTEMKRGVAGSIASSLTAPVDTWTQAGTPSFGATGIECVDYSPKLKLYVAGGNSGKTAYSTDGDTWTQNSAIFSGNSVLDIVWNDDNKVFYAVGTNGAFAYSSDGQTWTEKTISEVALSGTSYNINVILYNRSTRRLVVGTNAMTLAYSDDFGSTWSSATSPGNMESIIGGCWSHALNKFFIGTSAGNIYHSVDGVSWTAAVTPSFSGDPVYWIEYSESLSTLVAVGGSFGTPKIAYSTDGDTWTQAGTISMSGARANTVIYAAEIERFIACGNGGQIAYSSDGNVWTLAATPSFGGTYISDICVSPLNGRIVAVGGSGKIARSAAFANTISASIAGFTVQAVQYSGTVTAYNCTLKQPGTTAALSTENCRFTESGAHISNNAQTHSGLLVEGDVHFTTTPAAQNAFSLTRYTVAGRIHIHNASATYFEEIKDGIVTDGIQADYSVVVESGNVRGTCTNVIYGLGISVADPSFVDTTDYQLKREVNGYDEDSVCVEKSAYYYNSIGDRRDVGAWSYREENENYIYERAYEMRKPSAKDSTSHNEKIQTSLYWGEDMTPDVAVDPEARGEELTLNYRTLPVADVEFVRYLRTLKDPTVRIDYDPDFAAASTVTVNGNQSAGGDVLVLLTSTLEAGQKLTISGKTYYVMRMNSTTKAVLNKPLEDAVTDTQVLTVSDTAGKGVYQFVPQTEMNLTRFYENSRAYFKGVILKFVRKAA